MEFCLFTEPQQGASYDELLAAAQAAEAAGFDGFFRSDHYLVMGEGDGMPGPTDAWTSLAGLARETSRVRLGTLVSSVTYRHPGILAIQVAQVDAMSGGRVELGLGTGWYQREHEAYGIPFPEKRFGLLEESLEIIEGLWSTPLGSTYSFDGRHYSLRDSPALPKPAQERIPVIVGGGGPKRTPAIAARWASEFNIGFVDEATIAAKFRGVREAASAIDREGMRYSIALTTTVGRTDAGARARAEQTGEDPGSDVNIAGTVSQAIEKIGRLGELGADRVYLQVGDLHDLEHIALLGEVIAQLR